MKIPIYRRLFTKFINHKAEKIKKKYQTLELAALFFFVAIPSPGTGAYTGCLLAWFFKLDRKKSMMIIALELLLQE